MLFRSHLLASPTSNAGGTPAYQVQDVQRYIEETKASVLASLKGPELEGLAAYVDEAFPKLEDLPTITSPDGRVEFTRPQDATRKIYELLAKLGSFPSLTLDLSVESNPTAATVRISSKSGAYRQAATTNSAFSQLYRGKYIYAVTLAGYKSIINEDLDLVDDDRGVLHCELVAASDTATAKLCVRR